MELKPILAAGIVGGIVGLVVLAESDNKFFKGFLVGIGVQIGVRVIGVS